MIAPPSFGTLLRAVFRPGRSTGPRSWRRFAALLLVAPPFLALQLVHWIAFRLDDWLYPGFRDVEVRAPLFVVGLPRSGTTRLHSILSRDEERFTTLRLWELLFAPAVVERKIFGALGRLDGAVGRPAGRLLGWLERRITGWMDDVHPVSLDAPEEDYLLLLPAFATFLLILAWPEHPRLWAVARLDTLPRDDGDRLVAFYRSCVQRHLFVAGEDRRLLSKNPSFTPFVQALARAFPDARFVGCVRAPDEVVASQLSSLSAAARFFGWDVADPRFRDPIVDLLLFYAEHLAASFQALPADRRAVAPLSTWSGDVSGAVRRLYERFDWTPEPAFLDVLDHEGRRSRRHRSGHRYALADYGLTADGVRSRFAPALDRLRTVGERVS